MRLQARQVASPAFGPLRPWLDVLVDGDITREALNALVAAASPAPSTHTGKAIHFVAPGQVHVGASGYETHIHDTGEVPTRLDTWHDVFNALSWVAFPYTKAALNALHVSELARPVTPGTRTRARDAATLFDEGGIVVLASDTTLFDLMREHRWTELFVTRREAVRERMRCLILGHALYEKLLEPYAGITAKAHCVKVAQDVLSDPRACLTRADQATAAFIAARGQALRPSDFAPLPVLGVPGWFAANESPSFYDDTRYFRPLHATSSNGASRQPQTDRVG